MSVASIFEHERERWVAGRRSCAVAQRRCWFVDVENDFEETITQGGVLVGGSLSLCESSTVKGRT